jgi:trimethylamine--corrinoid protein Co-methyltransferase
LLSASTLLILEQLIFDDELYQMNRHIAEGITFEPESLALDVIAQVGPGGHFLGQKHTRRHVRDICIPPFSHPEDAQAGESSEDMLSRARERVERILAEHMPEPIEAAQKRALNELLEAAAEDIGTE